MALQQIDAKMLSKMFLAGAKNLENKKEWINELNVFPVPDGDTGTNMTMTIMSAAREVSALGEDADMAALCKAISSGSLGVVQEHVVHLQSGQDTLSVYIPATGTARILEGQFSLEQIRKEFL